MIIQLSLSFDSLLVLFSGKVYSSLSDGRVVEVLADRLQTVAFFDPQKLGLEECRKPQNTVRCGRPLGLKFDSKGTLYTVDPYHGLYSINVTTGETRLIVDVSEEKGLGARFLDDLALLEKDNGHMVFYLSDVSTEWDLFDVGCVAAEKDRSGRLLRYDTETGTVTVELSGLPFPNGLTFTDDRTALLMCLFNQRAVYKYIVSGDKAGKLVPLAGNLPGEPDNIKRSANREKETYWVGLFAGRNKHSPHLILDTLVETGMLKRFAFRFSRLVGFVIEQVGILLKSDCLTSIGFDVKVGYQFGLRICDYGLAVEIDSEGVILNSMHSPDGSTCSLSEAFEIKQTPTERHFLLGSYMNPYLGRLVLPKSAFQYSDPVSSRETTSKLAAAKSGAKSQVHEKVGESPKATTSDKTSGKATKPSSRSAARGKDEL